MKRILSLLVSIVVLMLVIGSISVCAAEVTGNTWIMPVSNYTSIGCRWACYCEDSKGNVIHNGDHTGNDIRANNNTMILATRSGTVVKAWDSCKGSHRTGKCSCKAGDAGNYVKIKHSNGYYTIYFHMRTSCVKEGDWVDQGDIIGYIGVTGNTTGKHTCMEYRNSSNTKLKKIDEIVDEAKAPVNGATKYLMTLRTTNKNIGIYEKPTTKSTRLGTVAAGEDVLCRIIQENYGFVEHNGVSGWILMQGNTTKKAYAFQLDYYKNSGSGKMSNTTHVAGENIPLPENKFKRSGYIFGGWKVYRPYDKKWFYKSPDGKKWGWYTTDGYPDGWSRRVFYDGEEIPGELFANITGRQVLRMTAVWVDKDAIKYTVKYMPEGGSGVMADTEGTKGVADPVSVCTYTMGDKVFAGWTASRESDGKWLYRNAEGVAHWYTLGEQPEGYSIGRIVDGGITTSPTTVDGDIIYLYAQWTTEGYLLLEPENGKQAYAKYVEDNSIGELPIPKKRGYHFVGWYTEKVGGKQIISLNNAEDVEGIRALYARWVPNDERTNNENYVSRISDGNQYTLALSQLLSAAGQQDETFEEERCYEYLGSVGMISDSGNVLNQKFSTSGFLEYYAPELTWYGESYICDNYDTYVTKLADMVQAGYYAMVKLDLDGTKTAWRYLYQADGENLMVVHNGEIVNAKDIAVGITSSNLFMYHGTEQDATLEIGGTYQYTEGQSKTISVLLDYPEVEALRNSEYKVWVAYYSEEELLFCRQKSVEFDSDITAGFEVECPESFEECRVYVMSNDIKPVCEAVTLENLN